MKSVWWLRVPFMALVVTWNNPHGVDGALDGQLLELVHGMEWWLLLALLRLSMALSLSVFSRLTLTSSFLIWLWRNDNSCTSYLACCQVVARLLLYYWWILWLWLCSENSQKHCRFWLFSVNHTFRRARLAWSVEWFVELWCFLKYACMRENVSFHSSRLGDTR